MSEPAAEAAAPPERPGPGLVGRLLALRTASVLTHRYVDLKLADLGGTLVLLAQAPVIGFMIARLAYYQDQEDTTLDFILALVAVWFGVFNGCREFVKERLIFLRERRTGVPVRAYVVSKVGVLAVLAALQCLILVAMVHVWCDLRGNPALVFLTLFSTTLAATSLGLLLSSVVKSQNTLIALVPIVLIPQLIFSDATLGHRSDLIERIKAAMIASWGWDMLRELAHRKTDWWLLLGHELVLLAIAVGLLVLATGFLRLQGDE